MTVCICLTGFEGVSGMKKDAFAGAVGTSSALVADRGASIESTGAGLGEEAVQTGGGIAFSGGHASLLMSPIERRDGRTTGGGWAEGEDERVRKDRFNDEADSTTREELGERSRHLDVARHRDLRSHNKR